MRRYWGWVRSTAIVCIGCAAAVLLAYRFALPWWLTRVWEQHVARWEQQYGVVVVAEKLRFRPFWFSIHAQKITALKGIQRVEWERPRLVLGWDTWPWRWRLRFEAHAVAFPAGGDRAEPRILRWQIPVKAELKGNLWHMRHPLSGTIYAQGTLGWEPLWATVQALQHAGWTAFSLPPALAVAYPVQGHVGFRVWVAIHQGALERVTVNYHDAKAEWTHPEGTVQWAGGKGQVQWLRSDPHHLQIQGFIPSFTIRSAAVEPHPKQVWRSALHYHGRWEWSDPVAWRSGRLIWERLHWVRSEGEAFFRGGWDPVTHQMAGMLLIPQADVQALVHGIPQAWLSPVVADWLHAAFPQGQARQIRWACRGVLHAFPYAQPADRGKGRFWGRWHVHRLRLHYAPDWPDFQQLQGTMAWDGAGLTAHFDRGIVSGHVVKSAQVALPAIAWDAPTPLQVQLSLEGGVADTWRYVLESPLQQALSPQTQNWLPHIPAQGPIHLALGLHTRLGDSADPMHVEGQYTFKGVQIQQGLFTVDGLEGTVAFTEQQVQGGQLNGTVQGKPWRVMVSGKPDQVHVVAHGTWALPETGAAYAMGIQGAFPITYTLVLPRTTGALRWELRSDLVGLAIPAWPLWPDWEKPAHTPRVLELQGTVGAPLWEGRYGHLALLTGAWDPEQPGVLEKLAVQLGMRGKPVLPTQRGWSLRGELAQLDATQGGGLPGSPAPAGHSPESIGILAGIGGLPLVDLDVAIHRFRWRDWETEQVHVGLQEGGIRFSAPHIAGTVYMPAQSSDPFRIRLSRWDISPGWFQRWGNAHPSARSSVAPEAKPIEPTDIPYLVIEAQGVRYGKRWAGQFACTMKPDLANRRLQIPVMRIWGPHLDLQANGSWTRSVSGSQTRLEGTWKTDGMGSLLQAWHGHSSLAEAPGTLTFALNWPGDPLHGHAATGMGEIGVQLGRGRLLDVDPGVGRVVGLLNLEGFTRRLRLDFSDFYKKGFSFDHISGTLRWGKGDLTTQNLVIKGTAAKIAIQGRTGLLAHDYDWEARVEPQVSGTLPFAAAVAIGSPAVGAAVWVADKLLNRQVNEISARRYHITGTWDHPRIQMIPLVDTGPSRKP